MKKYLQGSLFEEDYLIRSMVNLAIFYLSQMKQKDMKFQIII